MANGSLGWLQVILALRFRALDESQSTYDGKKVATAEKSVLRSTGDELSNSVEAGVSLAGDSAGDLTARSEATLDSKSRGAARRSRPAGSLARAALALGATPP